LILKKILAKKQQVIAACAALGAAGGLILLGPFSGLVAGGVAAHLATKDTELGQAVYGVGEKATTKATKIREDPALEARSAAGQVAEFAVGAKSTAAGLADSGLEAASDRLGIAKDAAPSDLARAAAAKVSDVGATAKDRLTNSFFPSWRQV